MRDLETPCEGTGPAKVEELGRGDGGREGGFPGKDRGGTYAGVGARRKSKISYFRCALGFHESFLTTTTATNNKKNKNNYNKQ